jgi:hypothetical protein
MATETVPRRPRRKAAARRDAPGPLAIRGKEKALLAGSLKDLSERITAIVNYLETVRRFGETEPAVCASHCAGIVPKAVAQAEETGRALQQLRRLLTGKHQGEAAAPPPSSHPGLPLYRVSFFNEFARNNSVVRACQRTIAIRSARSPERAVEAAKKRFARIERIRD